MSAEPLYPLFVSESVHIPIEHESGCNNERQTLRCIYMLLCLDVWMFICLAGDHIPVNMHSQPGPPGQNLHDVVTTGTRALCALPTTQWSVLLH